MYFSSLGEDEQLVIKEFKIIHTLLPSLTHFIESQEQLRNFRLFGRGNSSTEFYGIISALESQKSTLQEITLENCVFSAENDSFLNCNTELLKILDYNISTLEISYSKIDVPIIVIIVQILEKIGISLQRLKIQSVMVILEESLLLEAIKSFCPNIIYLYIKDIGLSTQLIELIGNLQKLQFLSLGLFYHTPKEEERKIRVMQFAKILPSTLQYINIALGMPDTLLDTFIDILLDLCNAPLKKLLISGSSEKNNKAIIRFCTQIRTLNYVGIVKHYELGYYIRNEIRNELEEYVTLVSYKNIVVNC
ncbi:hypothetical protein C2G38_2093080 [Gigaspora rosea]|uniref:F-box domain-containing protein n=1 Tax=Gigaspora rosea TaxID=44941 RepID=A0A397V279_9GLOM|nr:hypothetical protein C2G38_2093080 [Gigaspora rosea]